MAVTVCFMLFVFLSVKVLGFGYHVDLANLGSRRVECYSDLDLVAALQDDSIDRIVLMRDMALGADWDSQNLFPLHIRRNLTIKSSLEATAFASLDFRYLSGKLRLEPGVWLSIFRLRLRGLTASHAPSFPFVAISPGAHVLFQDCLLHRTTCVPVDLVYDSIRAPTAPRPHGAAEAPAAALPPAESAAGGDAYAYIGGGGRAGLPGACAEKPLEGEGREGPAGSPDIQLLRQYCFRTVASGRQCRPLALHLRSYSFVTQRRATGAVGTGGFVVHALNTTMVCDYPVSQECVRDNGPEFCVAREWTRRQRQQQWRRAATRAAVAVAGTAAALAAGWWLVRRQLQLQQHQQQHHQKIANTAAGTWPAASLPSPSPRSSTTPSLQWLADVSTEAEAEAQRAAAASGVPCRRPLLRIPSRQGTTTWSAGTVSATGPLGSPPSATEASGLGGGGGRMAVSRTHSASRASTQDMDLPAGLSYGMGGGGGGGGGGGCCSSHPSAQGHGAWPREPPIVLPCEGGGAPLGGGGEGPGQADAQPGEMLEYLGRLFSTCEVVSASEGGSGSSSVIKAAAETEERIINIRQTINCTSGAAGAAGAGADVYDHLEVTELLGSGTFGKVFKGFWHGTLVAVKLMVFPAALTGSGQLERMAAMEAAISSSLSHPNIVQTYTWRVTPLLDPTPLQLQSGPPPGVPAAAGRAATASQTSRDPGPVLATAAEPGRPPLTGNAPGLEPPFTHHNHHQQPAAAAAAATRVAAVADGPAHVKGAAAAVVSPTPDPKPPSDQLLSRRQAPSPGPEPGSGAAGPALPPLARTSAPAAAVAKPPPPSPPQAPQAPARRSGPGRAASANPLPRSAGQLAMGVGLLSDGFELCLILELCDAGSLRDLLSRGGFRRSSDHGSVELGELLDVATDVARAMSYLHSKNIVHSDLKSRNVLLKSISGNPATLGRRCALVAKVSDFGLSLRIDNDATHVSNMFQGTTAFMAPELLLYGRVSKASDVYSFGILMWEMYTCGEAFKSVPKALLSARVVEGLRPDFPPETPQQYRRLAEQCWGQDPMHRPSFDQIVRELHCLRAAANGEPPPAPAQPRGSVTAQLRRNSSAALVQARTAPPAPPPPLRSPPVSPPQSPGPRSHLQSLSLQQQQQQQQQYSQQQLQQQQQQQQQRSYLRQAASPQPLQMPPLQQQQRQAPRQQGKQHGQGRGQAPLLETVLSGCDSDGGGGGGGDGGRDSPLPLLTAALNVGQRRFTSAQGSSGGGAAAAAVASGLQQRGSSELASATMAAAAAAAPAAGSSSLGPVQLQRLIDANLLVVGGGDSGSTMAEMT